MVVQSALRKLSLEGDIEAYLSICKRDVRESCSKILPEEQWADMLASLLKAYFDMQSQDAKEYPKLKEDILSDLELPWPSELSICACGHMTLVTRYMICSPLQDVLMSL